MNNSLLSYIKQYAEYAFRGYEAKIIPGICQECQSSSEVMGVTEDEGFFVAHFECYAYGHTYDVRFEKGQVFGFLFETEKKRPNENLFEESNPDMEELGNAFDLTYIGSSISDDAMVAGLTGAIVRFVFRDSSGKTYAYKTIV